MAKIQLGYWDIRGFAEPARMMLEYGGFEYENVLYQNGLPDDDIHNWQNMKFKLGLDFPNLPYLFDGDAKFSESWAIYKYLGKKLNMLAKTDKEDYQIDMMAGVIQDLRIGFARVCYNPDFANLKDDMRKSQTQKLEMIEKFLEGKQFLIGDRITYVDFPLFESLDHHRLLFPDIFDKFPNVDGFMKRFESLEKIAAYFSSCRYKKFPINGKMASWGGSKEQ